MDLTRGGAAAFAGAMAFSNDGCAARLHGDADAGKVDRQERSTGLASQHTAGFERFPAPAIKAEDAVGLRDGVPALQVGKLPAVDS